MLRAAPRTVRRAYAASALLSLALFLAWTRPWQPGGAWPSARAFVDVTSTLAPCLAAALCLRRARATAGPLRPLWASLGLAALAWGLGNAAWTAYELVLQVSAPLPSWADLGYLLLLPTAAVGLVSILAGGPAATSRTRTALDGLIIAGSLFFAAWAAFLRTIVQAALAGSGLAAQAVSLAYPTGDVALLAVLLLVLSRAGPALRPTLLWCGAFLACLAFADVGYWYLNAVGAYETGAWTDIGWVAAFLALGWAALRPAPASQEVHADPGLLLTLAVLAPAALAAGLSAVEEVRAGALDPFEYWVALAIVSSLLVRQVLFVAENVRLRRRAEEALGRSEAALQSVRDQQASRTLMLNTVTHDIMSPLSAIRIQLRLLCGRTDLDPKASHGLQVVDRNVGQVGRLASDLKDLANLEAGKFRMEMAEADLAALARQAGDSFREDARQAGLALEVDAGGSLPVHGDAQRLQQVVYNLLSNAIRYTKAGTVTVSAERAGGMAAVRVRDTGRGLAAEEMARLFRPFSQVHARDEARDKGSGLGLFISRSIAESHGGRLRVASAGLGQGSCFVLEVPLRAPGPLPAGPPSAATG